MTISVGYDLGGGPVRPSVVVVETLSGGYIVRGSFVGDEAIAWLEQHLPDALTDGAPHAGHASFKSLEDIP